MPGHKHNSSAMTQNQGNTLGDRSCVRQSKLYRMYESGNNVKSILGTSNLCWNTDVKEGAYSGHQVFDHMRDGYVESNSYGKGYSQRKELTSDPRYESQDLKMRSSIASINDRNNENEYYHRNSNNNSNNNYHNSNNNNYDYENKNYKKNDVQQFKKNFKAMERSAYNGYDNNRNQDEEDEEDDIPKNIITMRNNRNKMEMRNNYYSNYEKLSSARDMRNTRPW